MILNEAFYYRDTYVIYLAQFVEACMHDQTRVPHSGLLRGEKYSEIAFQICDLVHILEAIRTIYIPMHELLYYIGYNGLY